MKNKLILGLLLVIFTVFALSFTTAESFNSKQYKKSIKDLQKVLDKESSKSKLQQKICKPELLKQSQIQQELKFFNGDMNDGKGDMNMDGKINVFDIELFTMVYEHQNFFKDKMKEMFDTADINSDNILDGRDIDEFIKLLMK